MITRNNNDDEKFNVNRVLLKSILYPKKLINKIKEKKINKNSDSCCIYLNFLLLIKRKKETGSWIIIWNKITLNEKKKCGRKEKIQHIYFNFYSTWKEKILELPSWLLFNYLSADDWINYLTIFFFNENKMR